MIFSVIAAIISAGNLIWHSTFGPDVANSLLWLATFNQVIASIFAVLGFFKLSGQRWRRNYEIGKPPIWTLRRAFTWIVLIGSLGAILLTAARFIGW